MRKVIVNSTPLIALSHIGMLHLLKDIYLEVWIPKAVYQEISAKPNSKCKQDVDACLDFIHVETIQNEMAKTFFKTQLHDGEVEVMILAKETQADLVIIDDRNAKKHATYLGFSVTGTLGILIKAKNMGLITKLKPLLEQMTKNGIYISSALIELCLKQVGEQ